VCGIAVPQVSRFSKPGTVSRAFSSAPRYEHRYISDTRAKIQDALPRANSGFPEEPLRTWGEPYGLSNQALVLRIRVAKKIINRVVIRRHKINGFYHFCFPGQRVEWSGEWVAGRLC
jgi:hypothetical protein